MLAQKSAASASMTRKCLKEEWSATPRPASAAPSPPSCKYTTSQTHITTITKPAPPSSDSPLSVNLQAEHSGRPTAVCQTFSPLGEAAHQLPGCQSRPRTDIQPVTMETTVEEPSWTKAGQFICLNAGSLYNQTAALLSTC